MRDVARWPNHARRDLFQETAAERTFWEKATILHQEAHRAPGKPLPPRYSRHYYDLYRMSLTPVAEQALDRMDLLDDVMEFKKRFYRSPWAKYDAARPGTLRRRPVRRWRASPHRRCRC